MVFVNSVFMGLFQWARLAPGPFFIEIFKCSFDFVRLFFDNPNLSRCRSSDFNGFSILGGYEQLNISQKNLIVHAIFCILFLI